MHHHRVVGTRHKVLVPHRAEQVLHGHYAAAMLDQIQQDGILNGRQAHRRTVHHHGTGVAVDLKAVELDGRRLGRLRAATVAGVAAQLGMDARDKLQRAERLDNVIVCAERKAFDLVLLGVTRRQHNYGIGMVGTNSAQQFKTVDIGQHDIQQCQVKLLLQDRLGRIGPAVGDLDVKALFCKVDANQVGDGLFVINYQNALVHACSSRAPLCPRGRPPHTTSAGD